MGLGKKKPQPKAEVPKGFLEKVHAPPLNPTIDRRIPVMVSPGNELDTSKCDALIPKFVSGRRRITPERFDHRYTMVLNVYLIARQPFFFRKRQPPTTHGCGQCGSCVGHRSALLSNRIAI